jgi:energy-coupling factor transporter transmembrane protein EcfT
MDRLYLFLLGLIILLVTVPFLLIFCIKLFIFIIKRRRFPKYSLIASLTGIIALFSIFVYSQYFFTFDKLQGELLVGPVNSHNNKYTANAYYETYGGAAGGVNVWVEITYNDENDKMKTVYYSDGKSHFSMEWKNEDKLYIVNEEPGYPNSNRSIELEIGKDIYDESGLACQSFLMKNEYETCFHN